MRHRLQRPLLSFASGTIAATMDGNSLVNGSGASGGSGVVTAQLGALAPFSGITITNVGVGGQTINNMRGLSDPPYGVSSPTASDVDGAFVAGKTNILYAWEATNSIFANGYTGAQAADQMRLYCQERLAVHPWKIVIVTTIPRYALYEQGTAGTITQGNLECLNFDALVLQNYRTYGASAVAWIRSPGSPFILPDYSLASFQTPTVAALYATDGADLSNPTHLQDAGYAVVAAVCAQAAKHITR